MAFPSSKDEREWVGKSVGPFLLGRLVGVGAMGAVYRARDEMLRRDVAVKLVAKGDDATDEEQFERFMREARSAARLVHPNVVQIFQVGETDRHRFIAMEFVEGVTLSKRAKALGGRLDEEFAVERLREAADALRFAETLGICHRDLKPQNLLLTSRETLKITDFGLAAQIDGGETIGSGKSGQIEGTPAYMSPEQWGYGTIGPKADIYSLGCTFFRLLAGKAPYVCDDFMGYFRAHCTAPVPQLIDVAPEISWGLSELIAACMAKAPEERPSASELYDTLDSMFLASRSSQTSLKPGALEAVSAGTALPPASLGESTFQEPLNAEDGGASELRPRQLDSDVASPRSFESSSGQKSYRDWYGLAGFPFSDVRDTAAFWDGGQYSELVGVLTANVLAGHRVQLITGKSGVGKTLVCEMLGLTCASHHLISADPSTLFGTPLLQRLCRDAGLPVTNTASARILSAVLLTHATKVANATRLLVVVDGLRPDDQVLVAQLEELCRDASLSSIQFVITALAEDEQELRSVAFGEAPCHRLEPMTPSDVAEYVRFRVQTIGQMQDVDLDATTLSFLHARSGGLPRLINTYCHNALTFGALRQEAPFEFEAVRLGLKTRVYLTPQTAAKLLLGDR